MGTINSYNEASAANDSDYLIIDTTPITETSTHKIKVGSILNPRLSAKVSSVKAGTNVTVDNTDPQNPIISATGGGGSGSVTSVAASGTQGVTTSVINPTSAPSITVGLGNITPSSVAATGTVTGSNLSGTNTGDQTIPTTLPPSGAAGGDLSGTYPNPTVPGLASKQNTLTLTTTGTSGPATLSGATLNVPQYGGTSSPLTTKGDLYAYSTTNTRLPIGTDGQVLSADSTQTTGMKWIASGGVGTVTSVNVSGGTTGLTTSGGPVTSSGTITLGGTLALANGGTGATTQQTALNALAGTQSAGKYLRSDGTNTTLSSIVAADVPTLNQNTTGTAATITGNIPEGQVTNLTTDLAAKAPLASPVLTGTPTAPTQTAGDNSTKLATTAYVDTKVIDTTQINLPASTVTSVGAGSASVTGTAMTATYTFTAGAKYLISVLSSNPNSAGIWQLSYGVSGGGTQTSPSHGRFGGNSSVQSMFNFTNIFTPTASGSQTITVTVTLLTSGGANWDDLAVQIIPLVA